MLYIACAEFQFCIHYIQLSLEKNGYPNIQGGGQMPPTPNETL